MRKAGNLAIWVIISVIAVFVLYKVYNHFVAKAQMEMIRPQVSDNMEDNNGQKDLKSENLRQDSNSENNIEGKNDESKDSEGADKDKESGENELNDDEEVKDENKSSEENNEKIIAPDFTLEDINGKKVSLSDYRGKIVFLNFWATWCQYCVMEMPDLEKVHQGFSKGDDAVILTVNSDEDPEKVKKFIKDNNLTLPVLMDYAYEVNWMYGISSIPVTFVIGRDGSVYGAIPGMTNKDTLLNIYESIK